MKQVITVLDLGSNKIAGCACRLSRNNSLHVLALENLQSRGIKEGCITDISSVADCISDIMQKIQKRVRKRLKSIYITTKANDAMFLPSRGLVPLSRVPRVITRADVKRCLDIASLVRLPTERTIMQTVVRGFYVDGTAAAVKDPVGLYGVKLEVESLVVTARLSHLQNIAKCIDLSGFLLEGIRLSALASADYILHTEEKQNGVLLLDIGDTMTEGLFFVDEVLRDFFVVAKGVRDILDTKRHLRTDMLIVLLREALAKLGEKSSLYFVVLTGGGSLLDGVIEETENFFNTPTRLGLPKKTDCNLSLQDSIVHAPTLGFINSFAALHAAREPAGNIFRRALQRFLDIYQTYF